MLTEDLERNLTLCLHNSFCRNRESNVDPLPCCKQRVEEQKCWRTASNSVRIANDVLQDTEIESAESVSQEEEKKGEKRRKQRSNKEEVKTQNCFMCVKKLK